MAGETDSLQLAIKSLRLGEIKEALKELTTGAVHHVVQGLPIYSAILRKSMDDRRALTRAALEEIAFRLKEVAHKL